MIKTAIVSGACSGTGLALTRHLLLQQDVTSSSGPALQEWRVVLADINQEAYERIKDTLEPAAANGKESRHMFVRTDVSSWEDLANLFLTAFDWPGPGQGRIEFVASNAGIDDHALKVGLLDDDQEGADSGAPQKPDLRVLQVDLHSVLFATKLLVHYTRKTRRNLASADQEPSVATTIFEPKIVVTASMASQYPFFLIPQYTAAKHGCLGLVRALAPALLKDEGITINCIMPGTVDTGLIPDAVLAQWPAEHLTPLDTILRAFMELLGDWDRVAAIDGDVDSDAPDRGVKSGCAVECSGRQLWYRGPVDFKDDTMQWVAAQNESRSTEKYQVATLTISPPGVIEAVVVDEAEAGLEFDTNLKIEIMTPELSKCVEPNGPYRPITGRILNVGANKRGPSCFPLLGNGGRKMDSQLRLIQKGVPVQPASAKVDLKSGVVVLGGVEWTIETIPNTG